MIDDTVTIQVARHLPWLESGAKKVVKEGLAFSRYIFINWLLTSQGDGIEAEI